MSPDDKRHGEYAGYVKHLTDGEKPCQPCRAAGSRVRKRNRYLALSGRSATVPAFGTRRRVQALQALGWSQSRIAASAGLSDKSLKDSLYRGQSVYRATAEAVQRAYERLSMALPPDGTAQEKRDASYARTVARKRGWPPPLAWDDDRIDDPAYTPTGWQYRPADRADILADLLERDAGISEALRVLGVSYDALEKWCGRHDRGIWRRLLDNENPHRGGNQHREAS